MVSIVVISAVMVYVVVQFVYTGCTSGNEMMEKAFKVVSICVIYCYVLGFSASKCEKSHPECRL